MTLAVAGYAKDELTITSQQNLLIVASKKPEPQGGEYLYRGMAGAAFERRFNLADYVKVANARLENGLLTIELVRELRDLGYSVPVIFMTGSPDDTFRRAARALQCACFFPKPFPAQDMLAAIERASAHQPQLEKCA